MTLSEAEIRAIVKGAVDATEASARPPWVVGMRRMLRTLADFEFRPGRGTPLARLCQAGASYGWLDLEAAIDPNLLTSVSRKAKTSLTRDLRRNLERLTRPCLELERTSFGLAMNSLGLLAAASDPKSTERMFLGNKPGYRLFALFKKFPMLARLWRQSISNWREHVTEVLVRFNADRTALAHAFFDNQPIGTIADIRCSLSDPHNHGRTVIQLQFASGAIIYKPRPGDGEWEWGSLLAWMNAQNFRPRLRAGRVLRRKGYCWMECIEVASCKSAAEARRFYERIGSMIAVTYLLRAVDCHRDNLIASGEDPVLVDADALWHVSPGMEAQTPAGRLAGTGFFPNSNLRSLRSRSSILGRTDTGKHAPRMGSKPLGAAAYEREIVKGFKKAWHCLLGTPHRRTAFVRRLRRIQSRERRWIHWPTEQYAAIARASIQPAALRSGLGRNVLIANLCRRNSITPGLIQAEEVEALKRLDIPYFLRSRREPMPLGTSSLPSSVTKALRGALHLSFTPPLRTP